MPQFEFGRRGFAEALSPNVWGLRFLSVPGIAAKLSIAPSSKRLLKDDNNHAISDATTRTPVTSRILVFIRFELRGVGVGVPETLLNLDFVALV